MPEAMLREYETIYVLKPDLEDTKIVEVAEKLRGVVESTGGKSLKIHNWGKKKLAFEVDKIQKGMYIRHHYLGQPQVVPQYERVLKLMDEALLYQTIKLATDVDPESCQAEEDILLPPVREPIRRERFRDDGTDDAPVREPRAEVDDAPVEASAGTEESDSE